MYIPSSIFSRFENISLNISFIKFYSTPVGYITMKNPNLQTLLLPSNTYNNSNLGKMYQNNNFNSNGGSRKYGEGPSDNRQPPASN